MGLKHVRSVTDGCKVKAASFSSSLSSAEVDVTFSKSSLASPSLLARSTTHTTALNNANTGRWSELFSSARLYTARSRDPRYRMRSELVV